LLARLRAHSFAEQQRPAPEAVLCPGEPLHALYRKAAAHKAEQALHSGCPKLLCWVDLLNAVFVTPETTEQAAFLNLNTPEDYHRFITFK